MGFFTINRKFVPIKAHYSLFNAGTGTVQPTMPVYAKVLGFSSFVVGIIYTILPILGLFIKPAFGAIADKFKWHRGVLLAWELIIIIVYLGIWFIPPAHPNAATTAYNIDAVSACTSSGLPPYLLVQSNKYSWTCDLTPQRCASWNISDNCAPFTQSSYVSDTSHAEDVCVSFSKSPISLKMGKDAGCLKDAESADDDTYSQWQFWLFLVLLIGAWGGTSVVTTLTDTICIEICETSFYGQQRLWGSASWGVLAIINGLVIDAVSSPDAENKNYDPAFYLMLAPLILDLFVSYRLKFTMTAKSENLVLDVWKVMVKPRNAVFMVWCCMAGISFALLWNFLYWLLEDLAAAQGPDVNSVIKTIEGLVSGVQCFAGEVPAFFYGGRIVEKIGHGHAITLVFFGIGLRYSLYSILVNPWWCMPIEILQSNFGLFYSTMTSYAKIISPPGTEATVQSVLCAVAEGIGVAIGSFLGGLFYDNYGGSITFRIFGILFFVLAVINELIEYLYRVLDRREAKQLTAQA